VMLDMGEATAGLAATTALSLLDDEARSPWMSLPGSALAIANYRRADLRHPRFQRRCIYSCGIYTSIRARGFHIATNRSVS
jgi:hypothetical protein